ncbi:Trk-type K+ transport system, membrane component [Halapricum desulfuricans]|uniref:Trk-type K+ transport system, membrane component n=1 Tax=Halapricum desulfuricans TaxID=2841257 RepID=A0A897NHF3_9EURY|nr:TrkH family potassium uptake protein [Halapricum desulfuricans]QSG12018.1 Trk-type K+ transport system, membrane component [Halapricum desulfuricans]
MATVVDWRVSVGLVGSVFKYLSIPLVLPLAVALLYGDDPWPFLSTIAVALALGSALERLRGDRELGHREAFLLVSLTWLAVPVLGTMPYLIARVGTVAHPVNALFESMSGFTTTGATLLGDISVEKHGHAMLLWRQLTQWLGGMGILVLMVAILPELSVGGARLISEESPGVSVDKLRPKIQETARILWLIYIGFTVAAAVVYYGLHHLGLADNMGLYNAVAHALTTLPTGGFSPEARSIEAFSPAVQWAVIAFMIVAGTNFALFWYALIGRPEKLFRNSEFRSYLGTMVAVSALVAGLLFSGLGLATAPEAVGPIPGHLETAVRQGVFQVVAIVTTTGYASMDFNTWDSTAQVVLLFAMFLGGSAGSAAGSIKIIRWYAVERSILRELFTTVHPEAVRPVRTASGVIDEQTLRGVITFILVFIGIFAISTVLLLIEGATNPEIGGLSTLEAMSATIATLGNVGPGFGIVGPMDSYLDFSTPAKLYMIGLMWIGRLEVFSVLVVFTPNYWR